MVVFLAIIIFEKIFKMFKIEFPWNFLTLLKIFSKIRIFKNTKIRFVLMTSTKIYRVKNFYFWSKISIASEDNYQVQVYLLKQWFSFNSDDSEIHSELLESMNRLTVAITRAQYKFIAVGCARTLSKISVTKKLVDYAKNKNLITNLTKTEIQSVQNY